MKNLFNEVSQTMEMRMCFSDASGERPLPNLSSSASPRRAARVWNDTLDGAQTKSARIGIGFGFEYIQRSNQTCQIWGIGFSTRFVNIKLHVPKPTWSMQKRSEDLAPLLPQRGDLQGPSPQRRLHLLLEVHQRSAVPPHIAAQLARALALARSRHIV